VHEESKYFKTLITRDTLVRTIKWLIRRINTECFNRSQRRKRHTIGAVVAVEGAELSKRIHAHLALSAPDHINFDEFKVIIERLLPQCRWINKKCEIKPYLDSGWLDYMFKTGQEALATECLFRAFP
jgi:hypothetical protein